MSDEPQAQESPEPSIPHEPAGELVDDDQVSNEAAAAAPGTQAPDGAAGQDPDATTGRVGLDRRQIQQLLVIAMIGVSLTTFVLAEIFSGPHGGGAPVTAGIRYLDVASRDHVPELSGGPEGPPAGGNHKPTWQNCGFYDEAVDTGAAVHSLEHGAVWLTYRQDLSATDLDLLRRISASRAKVLISRWDGSLSTPLLASAWGAQQPMTSASDPGLEAFLRQFEGALSSPEHDGPCTAPESPRP